MCTKEMPDTEVARLVNHISNCKLSEAEWQFGKRPYSRADPPPAILRSQPAADALEQGHEYLLDRSVSEADDPDLGAAAMEEDDATGGGVGAGGSGRGGVEDWSDDDEEEAEPRSPPVADKAGARSSAAPTAPGGAPKRRADTLMFGSRPKKPKSSTATTKRLEAAAWAAQAPLSLERSVSPSVIGVAEGPANTRCMDPRTEIQAATEQNMREAHEEKEEAERQKAAATKAAQDEADAATKAQDDAMAKERADAAAKVQEAKVARSRAPLLVVPLRVVPQLFHCIYILSSQ
nr:uncharacterized protein LOC120968818 [Aegilops tauschii subsp. strangulata]